MKLCRHVLSMWLLSVTTLLAQQKPGTFTDAKEAGPDFKVQGEYVGEVANKGKLGAQVFAAGGGKFDVYFLGGGLPGVDTKLRTKTSGVTRDSKTTITGAGWTGIIDGGKLTGKTPDGEAFTLSFVERKSPTIGEKPPQGASILFDGSSADGWNGGKIVENNLLNNGTSSKKPFATGRLHLEFRTPFQPAARGQERGNSGVYIHGKEIQVLDSFALDGKNNECGGFYSAAKPAVNMCFPPLSWQTYDLEVKPGDKADTLLVTVRHNGVVIHENYEIKGSATKGATINLQNHGNPVHYRNIWFAPQ